MANNYINLDKTNYTIPNNVYGFEIKYQSNILPNQITVQHSDGDNVMTEYKVYADYIFISVNPNEVTDTRTEYIKITGADVSQEITVNQKANTFGIGFSVTCDVQRIYPGLQFDVKYNVTKILLEELDQYKVRWEKTGSVFIFVREAKQPGTLNGLYTFEGRGETNWPDEEDTITVYLEKYIGSGQYEVIMKKEIKLTWSSKSFYLSQDTIMFDYLENPTDKNYVQVISSVPITDISVRTKSSETFKFDYEIIDNYIYITKIHKTYPGYPEFKQQTVNVYVNRSSNYVELTVKKDTRQNVYLYPIWKDIYIDLPNGINYFRVVNIDSGFDIYNGMIYGFITTKIGISDIVRDYMTTVTDPFINIYTSTNFLNVDVLISEDKQTWRQFYTFSLYYNYSYDDVSMFYLDAQPIDYYDPRQYLMFTAQDIHTNKSLDIYFSDSTSIYGVTPKNNQSTITIPANMRDSYTVKYHEYNDFYYTKTYKSKCSKTNYAVYYINRYGGWSWMLFNGKNIKSDKTTHNTYSVSYDNNIGTDYQTKIYQNDVQESWTLTTDYLTDKQSELLKHLYSSPLVYLHDLEADKVISVLVDTKSFEYKTFKNQGRKFFTHTIKVNSSQTKIIL